MTSVEPTRAGPRRRWLGLPPRVALGFGAAVVCLAAASVFSVFALAMRTQSSALVAHAADSQLAIEEVESALLIGNTALDAYLATGDVRHRALLLRASSKLEPALSQLASLTAQDAGERAHHERFLSSLADVRAENAQAFALAEAGDRAGARALRARGAGITAADRAKEALEEIERHEEEEVAAREAAWNRNVSASNAVFATAVVVLFVLIALAARVVRDEIRARERNEDERSRALEVQRRFMAVVSHDLRNPLTGILAAGWGLARADLPRDSALLARRIVTAGRRMERLIRDVLDWSRVHAGASVPLTVCAADAYDVCRRITEELSDRQSQRIRLERDGDTRALFDPDRMEQVVANLVVNALKYSPPDQPVRLRAVGEGREVRLEVVDSGPGIPPAIRKDLFEPFRRGQPGDVSDRSSLGLGLFIVRSLTEAQGGRIEVESEPGRGTSFVVRLPRPDEQHRDDGFVAANP